MNNIFKKYLTLTITFLVFCLHLAGQNKRTNNWYFGFKAGIDFNKTPPESLTNGSLNTREGCATISDENGNLLFYTDGKIVYDRDHDIMQNGTGLWGNRTSTQSSIIVPDPGDTNLYYIFTVQSAWKDKPAHFAYSKVDMTLDYGLGGVISKNTDLYSGTTEKLTAVLHKNLTDIWVISHKWNSDEFYVYLITESGLSTTPTIKAIGTTHFKQGNGSWTGQMKVSPNGKKIALAVTALGINEIFDFDASTGEISNPITISNSKAYGVEFSPNSSILYLSNIYEGASSNTEHFIYQIDLTSPDVASSRDTIVHFVSGPKFGSLQLAPDNKIYVARENANFISAINKPNLLGTACEFQDTAINLGNRKCKLGLPNFIQSSIVEDTTTTTTGKTKPPSEKECESCIYSFAPEPGKKYVISAWVKEENYDPTVTSFNQPRITIQYPGLPLNPGHFAKINAEDFKANGIIIDGWQRIQGEFTIPANAVEISIKLECFSGNCFFDDIRFHPFDASMKSFVYDPVSLKLTAILDENNYATFYEYDEEGKPIRVKKETERGIMTIKENRNSLIK